MCIAKISLDPASSQHKKKEPPSCQNLSMIQCAFRQKKDFAFSFFMRIICLKEKFFLASKCEFVGNIWRVNNSVKYDFCKYLLFRLNWHVWINYLLNAFWSYWLFSHWYIHITENFTDLFVCLQAFFLCSLKTTLCDLNAWNNSIPTYFINKF